MLAELRDDGAFGRGPERRLAQETVAEVLRIPQYTALAEQWRAVRR